MSFGPQANLCGLTPLPDQTGNRMIAQPGRGSHARGRERVSAQNFAPLLLPYSRHSGFHTPADLPDTSPATSHPYLHPRAAIRRSQPFGAGTRDTFFATMHKFRAAKRRGIKIIAIFAPELKERCRSGRSGRTRNAVYGQLYLGFESLSLRHRNRQDRRNGKEVCRTANLFFYPRPGADFLDSHWAIIFVQPSSPFSPDSRSALIPFFPPLHLHAKIPCQDNPNRRNWAARPHKGTLPRSNNSARP